MAVTIESTPNPNALKFAVGRSVGGPTTYRGTEEAAADWERAVVAAGPVLQVFLTADFVSVTKDPGAEWDALLPGVKEAIEAEFG